MPHALNKGAAGMGAQGADRVHGIAVSHQQYLLTLELDLLHAAGLDRLQGGDFDLML